TNSPVKRTASARPRPSSPCWSRSWPSCGACWNSGQTPRFRANSRTTCIGAPLLTPSPHPPGLTLLHSAAHVWYAVVVTDEPKHKLTADVFPAWVGEQQPEAGKFELGDGEVVMRHGPGIEERAKHWEAKTTMVLALHDAIERAGLPCHVASDGPMV